MKRSTVRITTLRGEGSGIIFDARGYVLTADHVVRGVTSVTVYHTDGRRSPASSWVGTRSATWQS